MHNDDMINIGAVENGFIIGVRAPYREDGPVCCGSEMKQFFVKTAEEAGAKVAEILPKLKDELDIDEVFKQVVKETADE